MRHLDRREHHLLGGLGAQILIVALLVFVYTQALRNLKMQRELQGRLQEQLTMAREGLARPISASADLKALEARLREIRSGWAASDKFSSREVPPGGAPDVLTGQAAGLKEVVEGGRLRVVEFKISEVPAEIIRVRPDSQQELVVQLLPVELRARGRSGHLAQLLSAAAGGHPRRPLAAIEMKRLEAADSEEPMECVVRWLVPVIAPDFPDRWASEAAAAAPAAQREPPAPSWGPREEPFLAPWESATAYRVPDEKRAAFRLTGIVLDPERPSCIVNEMALRIGDWVEGYQIVWITSQGVLLSGPGEELFLPYTGF